MKAKNTTPAKVRVTAIVDNGKIVDFKEQIFYKGETREEMVSVVTNYWGAKGYQVSITDFYTFK